MLAAGNDFPGMVDIVCVGLLLAFIWGGIRSYRLPYEHHQSWHWYLHFTALCFLALFYLLRLSFCG